MHLEVREHLVHDRPVIVLDGVIDVSTLPVLHARLDRAIRDHPGVEITVDLDEVDALDDCGLGILLGCAGRSREAGGDLVVVTTSPRLLERFARTRLDRAIEIRARLA